MPQHENMVCAICGKENPNKHQDFCVDLGCSGSMIKKPKIQLGYCGICKNTGKFIDYSDGMMVEKECGCNYEP